MATIVLPPNNKIENKGETTQGKLSAREWNALVDAVSSLGTTVANTNSDYSSRLINIEDFITLASAKHVLHEKKTINNGIPTTSDNWLNYLKNAGGQSVSDLLKIIDEIQDVEDDRVLAEAGRASAEIERQRQETIRQQTVSELEASDADRNEAIRLINLAEAGRNTAEATRKSDEDDRKTEELSRQSSEEARNSAEEIREDNEDLRISNEISRATAETNRNNKENERVSAENQRIINEENRSTSYLQAEIDRNNSFLTTEQARQQTFEENEGIRNGVFDGILDTQATHASQIANKIEFEKIDNILNIL